VALESLRAEPQTSPYIVEFNPWQWAGQDQLAQAFFGEIGKELGRRDGSKEAKKSAERWRKYRATLGVGAEVFAGTRRLALAALTVIGSLGLLGSFFEFAAVRIGLILIAFLAFLGLTLLKTSDGFAKAVDNYFSAIAEVEKKSLDEIKTDLSILLRGLKRPMLVVIDDVDRLTGPETRLLFQLIKANADFPNIIYLVLFQREAVEGTICRELSTDGREYLKKIVQVGFDVPSLQRSKLERVLFSKLDVLLQGEAIQKLWSTERWTNIFVPGLGPYFKTLRDVYRFISSLSLQFAIFSKQVAFEVNPIDLISLEVLRVFEPEVYRALPNSKDALTDISESGLRNSTREGSQKTEIQGILDKASEQTRQQVQEILERVFPPISWVFSGSRYSSDHSATWFREHRACHADVFDKYFLMAIPEGDLSHAEIENLVSLAGDRDGLVAELRSIGKRNLLEVAINRLESYKETIDLVHAVPFLCAMFDLGDELPLGGQGLTEIPTDMHAARIVYWYLKRESSISRRKEILKECIGQTNGLYLPAFVVALEGDKIKEGREEQARLTDDAGVQELKNLCVSKILQRAGTGTLISHPRLGSLLNFWQEWSSVDEAKVWVGSLVESHEGLVRFLVAFTHEVRSYGAESYTYRSSWQTDLQGIERFVTAEQIESRLAGLEPERLEGVQKEAIKAFHLALKRKREGKSGLSRDF